MPSNCVTSRDQLYIDRVSESEAAAAAAASDLSIVSNNDFLRNHLKSNDVSETLIRSRLLGY